jgi:hypothetical protein
MLARAKAEYAVIRYMSRGYPRYFGGASFAQLLV